jgi:hypothetical protein
MQGAADLVSCAGTEGQPQITWVVCCASCSLRMLTAIETTKRNYLHYAVTLWACKSDAGQQVSSTLQAAAHVLTRAYSVLISTHNAACTHRACHKQKYYTYQKKERLVTASSVGWHTALSLPTCTGRPCMCKLCAVNSMLPACRRACLHEACRGCAGRTGVQQHQLPEAQDS